MVFLISAQSDNVRAVIFVFYSSLSTQGRRRFDAVNVARQRVEKSRPLSRVLSWTAIPLGCASPRSSSDLPGSPCGPHVAAEEHRSLPYLVLLQVGFAMPRVLPPARCALTAPFHPYRRCLRSAWRYLSVALSVDSRPPGVTWHLARRSPDFPPPSPAETGKSSGCLADS
jgi:hypothetical protein